MNFNGIKELIGGLDIRGGCANYVSPLELGGSDLDRLYEKVFSGGDAQIETEFETEFENLFEDIEINGGDGSYSIDGFSLFVDGGAVKDVKSLFVENDNINLGKSSLKDLLNQF